MRTIRSFVRREGRLTPAQRRAVESLLPRYGLDTTSGPWDFVTIFGRDAPRTLEIGFGNGETLLALALANPHTDFIGIEVHRPGMGSLLNRLANEQITNVRVACADVLEVLGPCAPDASLDTVLLYFPDPWPKKRHRKRRLVRPEFVALLAHKLKTGGVFRAATDWSEYAEQMAAVFSGCPDFIRNATTGDVQPQAPLRPLTKFERRSMQLGHTISELGFRRR